MMKEKRIFSEPKLDVVRFTAQDVIATSGENFAIERTQTYTGEYFDVNS